MAMRIGTETGSMTNYLLSGTVGEPKPEVGMGATILMFSDRHAATIIEVSKSGHKVVVQRDKAIRTDKNGLSESQSYTFERDTEERTTEFRRTKRGYREKGGGCGLRIGDRSEYYDFTR